MQLLDQLVDSKAYVSFTGGLDARFITDEIAEKLSHVKTKILYFAFDYMKNEKAIIKGLETFKRYTKMNRTALMVYVLVNYDTTIYEDIYRLEKIAELGYTPYVMIYRKKTAPRILIDMQRYVNNRFISKAISLTTYLECTRSLLNRYTQH